MVGNTLVEYEVGSVIPVLESTLSNVCLFNLAVETLKFEILRFTLSIKLRKALKNNFPSYKIKSSVGCIYSTCKKVL